MLPPVQADLFGFVHRADQQTDPDRQQLNIREGDADVTGDDQSFIEDAVQDIDQIRSARMGGDAIHSFQETVRT
jgi:hypothetical protein